MKILITPDKFKGSLSAREVCHAIDRGIKKVTDEVEVVFHPMADGGDGSLAVLAGHLKLKRRAVHTSDPLGKEMMAEYYIDSQTAFIEMASASGLVLLQEKKRNPLYTTTVGTGKMMKDAIERGCQEIFLFLGGSATNEAGMGIASTLGCRFLDEESRILDPIGNNLSKVHSIQRDPFFDVEKIKITLLCDVSNPLYGHSGAAYTYARQKGANDRQVEILDRGLKHFAGIIKQRFHIDLSQHPGSGAAGGIAASLLPLFNAQLESGFSVISELTGLPAKVQSADRVITGEGKLDSQSLQGKVVDGIAALCRQNNKPLTAFVGKNELSYQQQNAVGLESVYAVMDFANGFPDAMKNAALYLEKMAEKYAQELIR